MLGSWVPWQHFYDSETENNGMAIMMGWRLYLARELATFYVFFIAKGVFKCFYINLLYLHKVESWKTWKQTEIFVKISIFFMNSKCDIRHERNQPIFNAFWTLDFTWHFNTRSQHSWRQHSRPKINALDNNFLLFFFYSLFIINISNQIR